MPDTRPLRIVHLLRAPMGGLFRHVRDLAVAHEEAGHAVGVLCDVPGTPGYNENMVADLEARLTLGLKRVPISRDIGTADMKVSRSVLKIIKELKPDVLHGHGAKGGVYARAFGSLLRVGRSRVARFYSPHGGSLHYDPKSRAGRVYFTAERLLERMTDRIIFVAEYERRIYTEKVGNPSCGWLVNYNGLAEAEFDPISPAASAADFLFLGELRQLKGPDLFLEALATLRADGLPARALMVGDGPDRGMVLGLIERLNLGDVIELRGPMPAREAFSLARSFVMPSRAEALPYVVLEALGAGMTVIATDVGGIPEILGMESAALISANKADLTEAMRLALDNPEELRSDLPSSQELKDRFSIDTMAGKALEAYRAALT